MDERVARWSTELALDAHARLGEGPVWSATESVLYWVDIDLGRVHRFDPASGQDEHIDVGEPVGAVALRRSQGLVIAMQSGFALTDAWPELPRALVGVEAERSDTRMNDGACDTRGRFWAGTMHTSANPGHGSLYRLDPGGEVTQMLSAVTISNGIGWCPADATMYYVDTPTGGVDAFDFEPDTGTIKNRRRLVEIEATSGSPDGLAVDAEGCIWVALWEGWGVRRYSPDGRLIGVVDVPVARVTKCAFGGPALDELYITTASPPTAMPDQPHAGGLFLAHPGVVGLPTTAFAG